MMIEFPYREQHPMGGTDGDPEPRQPEDSRIKPIKAIVGQPEPADSLTWHCPSQVDRELANMLISCLKADVWYQLGKHFEKSYPYTLAEKYDLIYRLLGRKRGD